MLVQYKFFPHFKKSSFWSYLWSFDTFEYILYSENQSSVIANHSLQVHYVFLIICKYKRELEIVILIYLFSSNSAEMQVTAQDGEQKRPSLKKY